MRCVPGDELAFINARAGGVRCRMHVRIARLLCRCTCASWLDALVVAGRRTCSTGSV